MLAIKIFTVVYLFLSASNMVESLLRMLPVANLMLTTVQHCVAALYRFHAIYWPAFLMAAEMPLPKTIFGHSHWLVGKVKMSKSRGNVVDPFSESDLLTTEGLRYFLIRQGVPHQDADYTQEKAIYVINSQLANIFGNLANRSLTLQMNPLQIYPPFHQQEFDQHFQDDGPDLLDGLDGLADRVSELYDNVQYYQAVDLLCTGLRQTNAFYQYHTPWKALKLGVEGTENLHTTLHVTYESLRIIAILLQPVVPTLCDRLLTRLGIGKNERTFEYAKLNANCPVNFIGRTLGEDCGILFQKIVK